MPSRHSIRKEFRMDTEEKRNFKEMMITLLPSTVALTVGLCMILAAAFLRGNDTDTDVPANATEHETVKDIFNEDAEYYVIRENGEGKVSVYLSNGLLYKELDVYTALLSEKDRELLDVGIMARSDSELAAFIEGLCG